MGLNATESWVYTLGETEIRGLANAFNINAAGVVPVLRDRVVQGRSTSNVLGVPVG